MTQRTLDDQLRDAQARDRRERRVHVAVLVAGWLAFSLLILVLCSFGIWLINDAIGLGLGLDQVVKVSVGLLVASSAVTAFNRTRDGHNGGNGK